MDHGCLADCADCCYCSDRCGLELDSTAEALYSGRHREAEGQRIVLFAAQASYAGCQEAHSADHQRREVRRSERLEAARIANSVAAVLAAEEDMDQVGTLEGSQACMVVADRTVEQKQEVQDHLVASNKASALIQEDQLAGIQEADHMQSSVADSMFHLEAQELHTVRLEDLDSTLELLDPRRAVVQDQKTVQMGVDVLKSEVRNMST